MTIEQQSMDSSDHTSRAAEWQRLHDQIDHTLSRYGTKDAFGRGDYLLVDDDWGDCRQKLEVQNLDLLRPTIIRMLQTLLADYERWEIMFSVDAIERSDAPPMGLIIRRDEIIDELRRDFLPEPYRSFVYEGARPLETVDAKKSSYLFRRATKS